MIELVSWLVCGAIGNGMYNSWKRKHEQDDDIGFSTTLFHVLLGPISIVVMVIRKSID